MKENVLFSGAPVVVVCGHYGVGKTNFCLNLALDARAAGLETTLIDLDVVNPYFRSSDYADLLENSGVDVVAPVFARSNLDSPSLTGRIAPCIQAAYEKEPRTSVLIIDAGGDDVGVTALARFARFINEGSYEMAYVINRSRNLTQTPAEAIEVLCEIEQKSRLGATSLVNNTHLKGDTTIQTIEQGYSFAQQVAQEANLPLACTTLPVELLEQPLGHFSFEAMGQNVYPVKVYVCTPWE